MGWNDDETKPWDEWNEFTKQKFYAESAVAFWVKFLPR
jgi:hypothetical protein